MQTEVPIRIEKFDPVQHDRTNFDCGVGRLNRYLKQSARKQQQDDMTRVYVAVEDGNSRILGYHAINVGAMNVDELHRRPHGAPSHGEIPVLFLGQVAVNKEEQGRGVGGNLMYHVFEKACIIADQAGCYAIILDVISDGGPAESVRREAWYKEFGFSPFPSRPSRMFMTIQQVRGVVQQSFP